MSEPTPQDIANAELRSAFAERFRKEYAEAECLAVSLFGPGWKPVCTHSLVDHDEASAARRENRRGKAAAVVYTAAKDGVKRHFMVEDGKAREVGGYEEGFGAMLTEPDPSRTCEWNGTVVRLHRYGLYWSPYESSYSPRTAEQLAAARDKRESKAERKWQEEVEKEASSSLFPDFIRERAEEQRRQRDRKR